MKELSRTRIAEIESRLEAGYYWLLNPHSKQYQMCRVIAGNNRNVLLLPPDVNAVAVNEADLVKA